MRKLTLFLSLLCLCVAMGAGAQKSWRVTAIGTPITNLTQITAEGTYLLGTPTGNAAGKYIREANAGQNLTMAVTTAYGPDSYKSVVKITGNATEGYKFQFAATDNYIPTVSGENIVAGETAGLFEILADEAPDAGGSWDESNNIWNIKNKDNQTGFNAQTNKFVSWTYNDGAQAEYQITPVTVEELTPVTLTVNYTVTDLDNATFTRTVDTFSELQYKDVVTAPFMKDFAYTDNDVTGETVVGETGATINVTCTSDYPFGFATLTDGTFAPDTPWVTLNITGQAGQYVYAEGETVNANGQRALSAGNLWCFVRKAGTHNEFAIYNLAGGASKPLTCKEDGTYQGYNQDIATLAQAGDDAATKATTWKVVAGTTGFALCAADDAEACLGKHLDGKNELGVWKHANAAAGDRSQFTATSAADLIAQATECKLGNYVGGYTQLPEALPTAQQNYATSASAENLIALIAAFNTPDGYATRQLDPAGHYLLRCATQTDKYFHFTDNHVAKGDDGESTPKAVRTAAVVNLEAAADGKYLLSANGRYFGKLTQEYSEHLPSTLNKDEAGEYEIAALGGGKFTIKNTNPTCTNELPDYKCLNLNADANEIMSWTNDGDATRWYLIPAEGVSLTMKAAGDKFYSTAYLPFAVTASDAALYTGALNAEGNAVVLSKVTDAVPVGTGMIVESENESVTLAIATGEASAPAAEAAPNVLTGTYEAITLDNDARAAHLVLGLSADNALGFYKPAASITSLAANRAFIDLGVTAAPAAGLVIDFGGDATGVDHITAAGGEKAPVRYDLSGRRVGTSARGLLIENGHKVFIK